MNNDYPLCRYRCWGHCLIDTREFYSLVLLFIIILNQIPGGIVSLPIFATSNHLRICISITLFSLVKVGYNIFSIIYCLTPFSPSISDMIPETVISTSDNAMEAHDLALNSTFVVQGKYTGVVFATGDRTIMGCIVGMSDDTKGKFWFFVTIISAVALELFCISMIVWAAWLRNTFPGFEDASYSIGCLTLRTCRITARLNIELITFTLIELHRALLPPRSAGITLTN